MIVRRKALGMSSKQVAHDLGTSVNTVQEQLRLLYKKREAQGLMDILRQEGWLVVPDGE